MSWLWNNVTNLQNTLKTYKCTNNYWMGEWRKASFNEKLIATNEWECVFITRRFVDLSIYYLMGESFSIVVHDDEGEGWSWWWCWRWPSSATSWWSGILWPMMLCVSMYVHTHTHTHTHTIQTRIHIQRMKARKKESKRETTKEGIRQAITYSSGIDQLESTIVDESVYTRTNDWDWASLQCISTYTIRIQCGNWPFPYRTP